MCKIIEEEIALIGDSRKVYVGGFSQGCCMALHALKLPKRLGGIIACSGFLFPITEISHENAETPIFISHGKLDFTIQWLLAS
jgi:phospholipase/carboxylesterase